MRTRLIEVGGVFRLRLGPEEERHNGRWGRKGFEMRWEPLWRKQLSSPQGEETLLYGKYWKPSIWVGDSESSVFGSVAD